MNSDNLLKMEIEVPTEFKKYMRPDSDMVNINGWESITRKNFLEWYDKEFKKYRVKRIKDEIKTKVECSEQECEEVTVRKMELFPHQKIVRDYLNSNSPYRGLLIFHGLGVGKTCSSIAIAEAFKSDRKIVVFLQKSIKQNYISQLKMCGDFYFRKDNHWVFVRLNQDKELKKIMLKIGIPTKVLNREGGCFLIDFTKKRNNYDSLSLDDQAKLDEQINDMINYRYDFKHTNGLTTKQMDQMETSRYLDGKVIVIDEVHNLINGMASGGSTRAVRLNQLFMEAQDSKFVFLSGTPMKNIPFEIAKLYNVLRGYIPVFTLKMDNSGSKKLDLNDIKNKLYQHPKVDQVIIEPKNKLLKILRNPFGFIRNNIGLVKDESNNISNVEFQEEIESYIKELGYVSKSIDRKDHTLFPDDNDNFMEMFYDPIKNKIVNQDIFKRRIVGMTSVYSSARKELIPEVRTKEILKIPMSDYMFDKYAIVRKAEIERDKKSKQTSKKKKDDVFNLNSSYRAYSRMLCQFVFPEDIERPFKGDLRDIEINDEDMEAKDLLEKEYEEKISKAKKKDDVLRLKKELKNKIDELRQTDNEYKKRLHQALDELEKRRDEYLVYDNGNKDKLVKYSPKYAKIIERLLRDRGSSDRGLKFIYTEYKTAEGVGIFCKVLRANGYTPFKIKKNIMGEYELDFIKGEENLPKYAVWSGDEESDILLNIYNNNLQYLPDKIRKEVEKISKTNKNGQLLEILMTTKQGAEGLNTKNVRQLHVVEPYWNPVRLDQVVGRAVRIGSHLELKEEDRNVDIYIYLSRAKTLQLKKNVTMMNDFEGKTSDEVLFDIAERKREIMEVMLGLIRESAIDCSLNLVDNTKTYSNIKCMNFGEVKDKNSYIYPGDIRDELGQAERETRIERKTNVYKTLILKIKDKETKVKLFENKIYDYDLVQSGRPGKPIGMIIEKDGKKQVKFIKK